MDTPTVYYLIICFTAFVASGLTLFSGFGLGTILMPVFAIFFPLESAITLTAIVHFLNNIFKLSLLGKYADKNIVLKLIYSHNKKLYNQHKNKQMKN